jgi:hypothetical protein
MSDSKYVRVYRNLHKNCFSVVDSKTGRVIMHTQELNLENAVFKVRESGRLKVLETKQKNVHAFVCGYISESPPCGGDLVEVSYNPYFSGSFFNKETKEDVQEAFYVKLCNGKTILAKI